MVKRNPSLALLKSNYLFPEIQARKQEFLARHPEAKILHLGIGDTTQPLPMPIAAAMESYAKSLGNTGTYSGYGPEQGSYSLRKKIADRIYNQSIDPEEIFISDGAKCDIGRLQMLFGPHVSVAIQDPSYPVYVDGSLIQGISKIEFMACTEENQFFPQFEKISQTDLIYFCSPNNPTGAVATKEQLQALVNLARKNGSIILYDAAYSNFIQDTNLPRSIFEIDGARQVAIEVHSFSKIAGFTGVRLGWTVIPKELKYEDESQIWKDWKRLGSTIFNGASNIAQIGGVAVLEDSGWEEIQKLTKFYLENSQILKQAVQQQGLKAYGGENAPYVWVKFPGKDSWATFQMLLEKCNILSTPGSGFGKAGEGFIRFSAFAPRETVVLAAEVLSKFKFNC